MSGLQRLGESLVVGAVGLEEAASKERSGSTIVGEVVGTAGRFELIASHPAEQLSER